MKATEIQKESQEKRERITDRIGIFFETFRVGTFLNRSGICKVRGTSPLIIVKSIFSLPFYGVNFFRGIVQNTELEFLKDAAYDIRKSRKISIKGVVDTDVVRNQSPDQLNCLNRL